MTQRIYPSGSLPGDALTRALTQRNVIEGGTHVFSMSVQDLSPGWTPLGPAAVSSAEVPASGRVTAIATDSRNPSTIYIGSAGGGVWRSLDGGGTWQSLGDNLLSLSSGSLVLDDRNGVLYYGTGDYGGGTYGAGIMRSPDGGSTWMNSSGWDTGNNKPQFAPGLSSFTPRILLSPLDPATILAARASGLWRSSDGGSTWMHLTGGVATDLAVSPADPNHMYLALGANTGDPGNGVYLSSDAGLTWTRVGGLPFGPSAGRITLGVGRADGVVYALIARPDNQELLGLYRSADGGSSWVQLSAPVSLFDSNGSGQGYFDNCIAVDPRNSNVIYLGGVELWKSADGGKNWALLSIQNGARIIHEDQFSIAFQPGNPDVVYAGNDGGIYRSTDGGATWASLNVNLPITQFNTVAVNPNNPAMIIGGTQDQGLIGYGGTTVWNQLIRGDAGTIVFHPTNPNVLFAARQRVRLMRSNDAGATWTSIAGGINLADRTSFYQPLAISALNPSTIYFGTYRVWTSGDSGNSWSTISGDLTAGGALSAMAVSPLNGMIYAGSTDGVISTSAGGGVWHTGTGVPQRWITTITADSQNGQVAYLTVSGFGSGHVFRTTDGGNTWTDISGTLPDSPANALAIDPRGPLYVAMDVGVFRSEDGVSWSSFNQGLPNAFVTGLALDSRSGLLTAATYGRSVFQVPLPAPATGPNVLSRGIVNSESFDTLMAPGLIASIFGSRLSDGTSAFASVRPMPTTLAGATVTVNGIAAPLLYVSPGQINFQVPSEVTGTQVAVVVTTPQGSASTLSPLQPVAPAIVPSSVQHASTGLPVDANNPTTPGEVLVMFAIGLGATNPAVPSGTASPANPPAVAVATVNCNFGGVAAPVQFAGLAPGFTGLYQVNIQVPAGVSGSQQVNLNVGGRNSNAVTIAVR